MISKNQIFRIYGRDFTRMTRELLEQTDLAALIPDKQTRIGVKPNLVSPTPAEYGATTHVEVVAGIIEYLQECGFTNITIAEGSWVGDKTSDAYEFCGYRSLCEKYGVPFVDAQKCKSHPVDCDGMELNICDVLNDIDFLINVPVLKGHCQTKMTCALKNMKGLIPNTEKRRFHTMGLHKPIAHLSRGIHQDFIVVDHICGDPYFEDGGRPLIKNCIMAARDPVLVDSYACRTLGIEPEDVAYVKEAAELGSGSLDIDNAEIITIQDADLIMETGCQVFDKTRAAEYSGTGEFSGSEQGGESREILDVSYMVNESDSCSACYASLVPALYRLQDEGLLSQLKEKISIGQGHQGKSGALGIGRCTKDFDFCVMGCPPDEDQIYEELKGYIEQH